MTTKIEICKYLCNIEESIDGSIPPQTYDEQIVGINIDKAATHGELAWISRDKTLKEPNRINTFSGSLLIAPEHVKVPDKMLHHVIRCHHPKLAFIKVVNTFFHELSHTSWPRIGEHPVHPTAKIGKNVTLSNGVVIGSSVIIEDEVFVGPNSIIGNCTLKQASKIGANCTIGLPGFGFDTDESGQRWRFPHIGRVIIEENVEVGSNTCIDRGSIGNTIIRRGAKIDNLVHIAHNVDVGTNSLVIANTMVGGSATIGENVWIAPSVSIMNQVTIGDKVLLGMGAVILKSVEESSIMVGNPARLLKRQ